MKGKDNWIIKPFKIWWRIYKRNAPFVTDNGAKNIQERMIFWIITATLPFVLVFVVVYIVDTITILITK
ncbi:MAG: hypothetical protein Q7K55_04305 [Candidatus Levybacteria bacterium]|nr:hypothetical protein [Candidatus Levybacteria bacterium]